MIYRQDLFDAAGLAAPTTFELIETAAAAFAAAAADAGAADWLEAGHVLRTLIFDPIAPHIGDASARIYICPECQPDPSAA